MLRASSSGFFLNPVLELGVELGQVFDHVIEGLAELPQFIRFPRRHTYAEVAAADDARTGQQIAEGPHDVGLQLENRAGPDDQQQRQGDALDDAQELELGLQTFLDERHQTVDMPDDLLGGRLHVLVRRRVVGRLFDDGAEATAPVFAHRLVGLADWVVAAVRDHLGQVRAAVTGFKLAQGFGESG